MGLGLCDAAACTGSGMIVRQQAAVVFVVALFQCFQNLTRCWREAREETGRWAAAAALPSEWAHVIAQAAVVRLLCSPFQAAQKPRACVRSIALFDRPALHTPMQPRRALAPLFFSATVQLPNQLFCHAALAFFALFAALAPLCRAGALHPTAFANSSSTAQRVTTLAFGSCMDQARFFTSLTSLFASAMRE